MNEDTDRRVDCLIISTRMMMNCRAHRMVNIEDDETAMRCCSLYRREGVSSPRLCTVIEAREVGWSVR